MVHERSRKKWNREDERDGDEWKKREKEKKLLKELHFRNIQKRKQTEDNNEKRDTLEIGHKKEKG